MNVHYSTKKIVWFFLGAGVFIFLSACEPATVITAREYIPTENAPPSPPKDQEAQPTEPQEPSEPLPEPSETQAEIFGTLSKEIFEPHGCLKCHADEGEALASVEIFKTSDWINFNDLKNSEILDAVKDGSMPKGRSFPKLNELQIARLAELLEKFINAQP